MDKEIKYAQLTAPNVQGNCAIRYFTSEGSYTQRLQLVKLGNGFLHVYSIHEDKPGLKPFRLLRATIPEKLSSDEKAMAIAKAIHR